VLVAIARALALIIGIQLVAHGVIAKPPEKPLFMICGGALVGLYVGSSRR